MQRATSLWFAPTIFCGAFLLFEVQPLIAKYILPWFGGTPAVWTTCMLFFQVVLLVGYAYAHLASRMDVRAQVGVHLALVAAAAALLPITPAVRFKPTTVAHPELQILVLLGASVGLQGIVLASTGPLVQSWLGRMRPGRSPYRLYALSNLGSLLALVSYPFLVEPALSRNAQARTWSFAFGAFAVFSTLTTASVWRARSRAEVAERVRGSEGDAPGALRRLLWFALPACACALLLATTNQMCIDVAVIPFLWVLPLGLYLVSFILVFDSPRWYRRGWFGALAVLGLAGIAFLLDREPDRDLPILFQIGGYSAALFVCCMVCHGELARLKPEPGRLTSFYLMIAAGGAFGGAFVALLAPFLFRGYFELHLSLVACCVLVLAAYAIDPRSVLHAFRPRWAWSALSVFVIALAGTLAYEAWKATDGVLAMERDFYGVLRVYESGSSPRTHRYILTHGQTQHGYQFDHPEKRRWPTCYYGEGSGVGLAARFLPHAKPRRIGAVGLGVGTVAAWGERGDVVRFYEINPEVERLARSRFTYLADSPADVDVVLGDARVSLEREAPQGFDILVLDAFSSDAIPVHLLTREAFEVYLRHLAPDGVIAVNVSNAYLDLAAVVFLAAEEAGLGRTLIDDVRAGDFDEDVSEQARYDREHGLTTSTWVLVTRNRAFLESPEIQEASGELEQTYPGLRPWTDDDASLFRILQ